jgi:hypothetical protein
MDHSQVRHKQEQKHPHEQHQAVKEVNYNLNSVKTLLTWIAPNRPYKKRQKAYFINLLLIVLTLEVILFLFSQLLLMLVVASLAFVSFAFATTPPEDIHYRISSEGIAIEDHFYLWQELYDFYFKERTDIVTLHVRTKAYLPGELIMLLGDIPKDKMRDTLILFLPYREVVRSTFTERAGDWLVKTFPLDETHHL